MKRYNKLKKAFTELKEGEQFCETCHGEGKVRSKRPYKKGSLLICKDCLGHGKLDWVECAVGKKLETPGVDIQIEEMEIVVRNRCLKGTWTIE